MVPSQTYMQVLIGLILQELERENKAHLAEADKILQKLESVIYHRMEIDTKTVHVRRGEPFLFSAMALLKRIEKLNMILSSKPKGFKGSFPHMRFDSNRTELIKVQVLRLEALVRELVLSHATNEARIDRNKKLIAKVDDLLLNLEQEK
uniref:Alpha-(1,3)-fucosyltransferase n=1 Tax=Anthurium amnicola TaxID=1678845 RepID=A0A1D1XXL6_9ARAE